MSGEITFHPSAKDYGEALRAHFAASLRARKFWIRFPSAVIAASLVAAAIAFAFDGDWGAAVAMGGGGVIGGTAAVALIVLINWLALPRRSRRLFAQQKTLHAEHRLAWDDRGLRWRSRESDSRVPWADYLRWRQAPCVILVYLNEQLFHFIPVRALSSGERQDLLATIATAGVPN